MYMPYLNLLPLALYLIYYLKLYLIILRAGTPTAVAFAGTSFTTAAPAQFALSPIWTCSTIQTLGPIYTLFTISAALL